MKSMRQRGNVACLTDAARSSDIRLDQADGTLLDQLARMRDREITFTTGQHDGKFLT